MQLGFVSAIVPDLSFEEVFGLAKSIGYECVEVMCWPVGRADRRYAGVTHIDVNNLTDAAIARIRGIVQSTGVTISGLGYYPNPLTPHVAEANAALVHLRRVILAAKSLGIPVVNTFVGRDWTKSVDENWPRFLDVWTDLIRLAEDYGVKVAIENCPMLFTRDEWPGGKNLASSPALWRRMFTAIPSTCFGLNYDPSHLALATNGLPGSSARICFPNFSRPSQRRESGPRPPGSGGSSRLPERLPYTQTTGPR